MAIFNYKINKNNSFEIGQIEAENVELAKMLLTNTTANVVILSITKQYFDFNKFFATKLTSKELINFFSSISAMDKVGIDILTAMKLMKEQIAITPNLKKVCSKIYDRISSGDKLSIACKLSSKSFTDDYIGLIAVAEKIGNFAKVFDEIIDYIKWSFDIETQAKSAFRGPLTTLIFMFGMIMSMSIFALPKILSFLTYFNMKPPIYTVWLINFSKFMTSYWMHIIIFIIVIIIANKMLGNVSEIFAAKRDRLFLSFPIFGELLLKIDISRFIAFFTLMYNSGVDILTIISSISCVVKNKYLSERISVIHQKIENGYTVFQAIDEEKVFPLMFRKMMSICEITGQVGPVLENVKYFYDKETKETIEKVVGSIKPAMTLLLGLVLIWIGSAMLGPIYSNIANIGNSNGGGGSPGDGN